MGRKFRIREEGQIYEINAMNVEQEEKKGDELYQMLCLNQGNTNFNSNLVTLRAIQTGMQTTGGKRESWPSESNYNPALHLRSLGKQKVEADRFYSHLLPFS